MAFAARAQQKNLDNIFTVYDNSVNHMTTIFLMFCSARI